MIRVVRILEYQYETVEEYVSDSNRWAVPMHGVRVASPHAKRGQRGAMKISSTCLPLQHVGEDVQPNSEGFVHDQNQAIYGFRAGNPVSGDASPEDKSEGDST